MDENILNEVGEKLKKNCPLLVKQFHNFFFLKPLHVLVGKLNLFSGMYDDALKHHDGLTFTVRGSTLDVGI